MRWYLVSVSQLLRVNFSEYKADEQKLFVVMEKGDTDLAGFFKSRKNSDVDYRHKMIQFYWLEMLRAVQVIHNEGNQSNNVVRLQNLIPFIQALFILT